MKDFYPLDKSEYEGPHAMCGSQATTPHFPVKTVKILKTVKIAAGSTVGFGVAPLYANDEWENFFDVSTDRLRLSNVLMYLPDC